ncbi:hypothetical protein FHG87_014727 [Trinorchestia longiramus]|nr:hypothetical protein FHG87_014727 [Trinorchestia longiramus]
MKATNNLLSNGRLVADGTGLNDFAVWGASCVDGKQREDLSDFKEYQDWMLKKKLVVMKRDAARPLPRSYEPNGRSFRDARHRSPPSRFSSHHPRLSSDDRRRRPPPSPLRRSSPNYRSVQPSRRQSPSPHRRLPLSPRWRHASPSARRHPSPLRRHASPSSRRYASPSSRRHTSPSVRSHASPSPRRRASPSSRRHRYPSPLIVMDEVLPTVLSRLANSPERKVPSRRYGAPSPPSHRPPGIPESYDERNACPDTPYAQRMHCSPMSRGPNRSWCYPPSPDSRPLPLRHSLHPPELTDNYC